MIINKPKIILCVDTGIDDALALLLAFKMFPNQIIGIVTSGGNVPLNLVICNTLGIIELANQKINVYKGSEKTLDSKNYSYAFNYHGENGLCGIKLISDQTFLKKTSAINFIIDSANKYKDNIIFISLGPLTTLVQAAIKNPQITKCFRKVIIMGGAVNVPGNETKYAEFNFYQDATAANFVISNFSNIRLVPLDVTNKAIISERHLNNFSQNNEIKRFINKLISNWYLIFGDSAKRDFELYDPVAITAVNNTFLKYNKSNFCVIKKGKKRGALEFINGDRIEWAKGIKANKFIEYFIQKMKP